MKWFKHMTDASNDEFLSNLADEFGLEGKPRRGRGGSEPIETKSRFAA
jgi:hypothetical protein